MRFSREERAFVNKSNLLIAGWIFTVSGCALMESSPSEPETSAVTTPMVEPENVSVPASTEAPGKETAPARSLTPDDVRRIQMRLKEAGFDAGPADGVAGARTKIAFNRYQAGCAKTKTLIDDFDETGAPNKNTLSRQDNQTIQMQLRRAGFDPGPADGIFGTKTRKTIIHLKTNCPTFNEFAALLHDQAPAIEAKRAVEQAAAPASASITARAVPAPATGEIPNQTAAVRGQEEIRVLQLRLRDAGFDPGPFDGVMGPKTITALQQYEASDRGKKSKVSLKTTSIRGQY
jgi:peptidoglycan hydrolase-like protein with peptidoglycan-binding domain